MKYKTGGEERLAEIVSFYYCIFGHRISNGASAAEARKEACDAVALRYGICRGRMLNIISEYKGPKDRISDAFRNSARELIENLQIVNKQLSTKCERNEILISLLEEYCDDYR